MDSFYFYFNACIKFIIFIINGRKNHNKGLSRDIRKNNLKVFD